MTSYNIFGAASPQHSLATITADTPTNALAEYSISRGYADPRNDMDEWFETLFDGSTAMVFENTELIAVES